MRGHAPGVLSPLDTFRQIFFKLFDNRQKTYVLRFHSNLSTGACLSALSISRIFSRISRLLVNFPLSYACKWLRYILRFSYKTIQSFTSFDVLSDYPHGVWIPRPCRKIFQHKITTNINSSRPLIFRCSLDHTPSVIRSS